MGCLIGSIWGYMGLAVFLVLRHRKSSLAFVERRAQEAEQHVIPLRSPPLRQ